MEGGFVTKSQVINQLGKVEFSSMWPHWYSLKFEISVQFTRKAVFQIGCFAGSKMFHVDRVFC